MEVISCVKLDSFFLCRAEVYSQGEKVAERGQKKEAQDKCRCLCEAVRMWTPCADDFLSPRQLHCY